jgi:hypothetical protein
MGTVTTGTKALVLLAAVATLGVLDTASTSRAQLRGSVERCSLSGVNPADHPKVFGNPATARSYGFVQVNGTWHVSRSLCGRGGRARSASASGSAKATSASAKKEEPALKSDGKCWVNTGGTSYGWGDCK